MKTEQKRTAIGIRAHIHDTDGVRVIRNIPISYSGVREFPVSREAAPGRYRASSPYRTDDFMLGKGLKAAIAADRNGDPRQWDHVQAETIAAEAALDRLDTTRQLHQLADDGCPVHDFGIVL